MKKLTSCLLILLCFVMILTFSSCEKNDDVVQAKLSETELKLNMNDEFRIDLLFEDLIVLDGIEWSSSNQNIATVKNGVVNAKDIGETTITATYKGTRYDCQVSVINDVISLSDNSVVIELNETYKIEVKQNGEVVQSGVTWRNSDNEVISLDNGNITALKLGDSTISAKYKDKAFICNVKVIEPFNAIGNYYCRYYVQEMDVAFEFDLSIQEDGNYTYSRRSNDLIEGTVINSGKWIKSNGMIICTFEEGEMRFSPDKEQIISIGNIDTGGMIDLQLTFDRVK